MEINNCRNCGGVVKKGQKICVACGFEPLYGDQYCQQCGYESKKGQKICINCGFDLISLDTVNIEPITHTTNNVNVNKDESDVGINIICGIVPVIGLILYIMWRDEKPKKAHGVGVGALIGVAIYFALGFMSGYMY